MRRPGAGDRRPQKVAFNLRQYSLGRRHIALPARPDCAHSAADLQMIDYLGGNGKWRQKKAQEEFKRREQETLLKRRQDEIFAREKERRREEVAAWRHRQKEEEEARHQEIERHNREVEQQLAEERRLREESLEKKRRAAERARLALMPKPCEPCSSTGKCPACSGKGHTPTAFLSPNVDRQTRIDFGLRLQGCKACGGFPHNVTGELRPGTGRCTACGGTGAIAQTQPNNVGIASVAAARVAGSRWAAAARRSTTAPTGHASTLRSKAKSPSPP